MDDKYLKACPFCGGDVDISDEGDFYMLNCSRCGCGTTFSVMHGEDGVIEASLEESIELWNRRA